MVVNRDFAQGALEREVDGQERMDGVRRIGQGLLARAPDQQGRVRPALGDQGGRGRRALDRRAVEAERQDAGLIGHRDQTPGPRPQGRLGDDPQRRAALVRSATRRP